MQQSQPPAATTPYPSRSGASRKLLSRKAIAISSTPLGETLEASFPALPVLASALAQASAPAVSSALAGLPAQSPQTAAPWSSEDERAFQAVLVRRKAAGYQRRGKDVSDQVLRLGDIKPNAGTVAAVIVTIVEEAGQLNRSALLGSMAMTKFAHPKAQPSDKGWCQGYVAGAIRNGFLAVVDQASTAISQEA